MGILPRTCRLWSALLFGAFSLIVTSAHGNGGGYSQGLQSTGAFKPFGIEQVEMLSEHLEIDLHIEHAEIRIEYVLHNPGPKVTVEAGFPSAVNDLRWGVNSLVKTPFESLVKLENFHLAADGTPLEVSTVADNLKLGGKTPGGPSENRTTIKAWHVFKLDFKKGQTRRLIVRYRNPYAAFVTAISSGWSRSATTLSYVFSSAASWAGPITQGTVIINPVSLDAGQVEFSHPNRFTKDGDRWIWRFSDLEPTLEDDLMVITSPACTVPDDVLFMDPSEQEKVSTAYYVCRGDSPRYGGGRWEIHSKDYQIDATSTLPPDGSLSFAAEALRDFSRKTCWVEGAPGPGIGEAVTLTLPKPGKVARVGLVNGYAKDQQLYEANNRIKRLDVSVNGGKPFSVAVPDERLTTEHHYFDLPQPNSAVKTIKLTIAEVYKGTQFDDTCLTDIVLVTPLSKAPKHSPIR